MLRLVVKWLIARLYKIEVAGLEHYHHAGDRVLIIANHLSFLDGFLLALFLPEQPMFAINSLILERWYFKPFFACIKAFSVEPANPLATKAIIKAIQNNNKCVIFPEGRITTTGSLMKIYEGPGLIADKSGAKILPIRIAGAQYSTMSRLQGKTKLQWFPKITITILPARDFNLPDSLVGKARRNAASQQLYDLMTDMLVTSSELDITIFETLINQSKLHGRQHLIAHDISQQKLNYGQLLTRSFALGAQFAKHTPANAYVGLMLPTGLGALVSFFALQAYGRIPVMLNFDANISELISACETAKLSTIYTARTFITSNKLVALTAAISTAGIELRYLEDLRSKITKLEQLKAAIASRIPQLIYHRNNNTATDAAVVVFTAGTASTAKAVVLSHRNLQANRYQLLARLDIRPNDSVFNTLPIYNSFGLMSGMLLPVLAGLNTYFYPSASPSRVIPELIYDTHATIMFSTDTALTAYANHAHPYDFHNLRYVLAANEKLKPETGRLWLEKFGVRILESYGATETAAIIATNTPMHYKPGTVGRLLPGISYKLEPVPGIANGGRLLVSGPNIMKGYLLPDNLGVLVPAEAEFYDTGDIVAIDAEGYLNIKGRARHFDKIAAAVVTKAVTAPELELEHYPS